MSNIIEHTTPQEIHTAEDNGARAFTKGLAYDPPRDYKSNPWLENAWRRGFVRAKYRDALNPLPGSEQSDAAE